MQNKSCQVGAVRMEKQETEVNHLIQETTTYSTRTPVS